jgi:hypothetical protein
LASIVRSKPVAAPKGLAQRKQGAVSVAKPCTRCSLEVVDLI